MYEGRKKVVMTNKKGTGNLGRFLNKSHFLCFSDFVGNRVSFFLQFGRTKGRLDGFNFFLLGSNSQDCFLSPFPNALI